MFRKTQNIHFVGIGGIGMSGIAEVLINLGYHVSGSDLAVSEITERLINSGAEIFIGHAAEHVKEVDVVVISSAVGSENPEVQKARKMHIPVIPRAEMLAELMRLKHGIAIAGTHGKTTTTSIIATLLAYANLDPTVVIGGKLNSLGSGAKLGEGELMVAEADESDGSFLKLSPTIAIVTTLDQEHMDYYRDMQHLLDSFLTFINKVPFYGTSILCLDQPHIQELIPKITKRYITYGLKSQADYTARSIRKDGLRTTFSVYTKQDKLGDVTINMPGKHNVLNALASVVVALELDVDFETIKKGMEAFSGVARRFQIIGEKKGVTVVDDYGHHPVEVQTTIQSARAVWEKRKIIVVFQPHRYSRTKDLLKDFFTVFYDADTLILADIYPAGEQPIKGITTDLIYKGVVNHGQKDVHYIKSQPEIISYLTKNLNDGDIVITLGAGDIWKLGKELLNNL